jgi:hypothetical protein
MNFEENVLVQLKVTIPEHSDGLFTFSIIRIKQNIDVKKWYFLL